MKNVMAFCLAGVIVLHCSITVLSGDEVRVNVLVFLTGVDLNSKTACQSKYVRIHSIMDKPLLTVLAFLITFFISCKYRI